MCTVNLYVGNLPFTATKEQLQELFKPFEPDTVSFVAGRNYAYIGVPVDKAEPSIKALDGSLMHGHALAVKEADFLEPRTAPID